MNFGFVQLDVVATQWISLHPLFASLGIHLTVTGSHRCSTIMTSCDDSSLSPQSWWLSLIGYFFLKPHFEQVITARDPWSAVEISEVLGVSVMLHRLQKFLLMLGSLEFNLKSLKDSREPGNIFTSWAQPSSGFAWRGSRSSTKACRSWQPSAVTPGGESWSFGRHPYYEPFSVLTFYLLCDLIGGRLHM